MKIELIVVTLLLCTASEIQKDDVVCAIELSVVKSKKFGQLAAVLGKIENRTNKKLYFDRMQYFTTDVLKQEGDKFVDFNEGWWSFEVINKDRDEIAAELRDVAPRVSVFDQSIGKFTDSLARAFYTEFVSDKRFVKSTKDSADVMNWVRMKFDRIAFLRPHQSSKDMTRINSLPPGSYKIINSYSDVNDKQVKTRLPHLKLPKILNGFERWSGTVSDTLYLNVK
ncbi:hypothetical protein SAMN04488109_0106 [Chryseolinea serpens]|uniref:Uncharacterized protein n=1 Tax=Chryseolinea serpens TaxID=947013 RepID=A0A1M5JJL9_9BACT|nr:hypothetical protein [Chryseolinea serpens]SHG40786.1 hypothetical protein SAMN04488109_0106 [Chryseolinea serpens]